MAKGYDPDHYIKQLTDAVDGIDGMITKVDEKIVKAKETQKTKDAAAAKAKAAVEALESEKARLEGNKVRATATLATAKGEPVPVQPELDGVTDFESEPAVV